MTSNYASKKSKNITSTSTSTHAVFIPTKDYLEEVRKNSYIGKKGYTLPKTSLYEEDYLFLKSDLTVQSKLFSPVGMNENTPFPVYRENDKKIYIPRFYGIQRYGTPDVSELSSGETIDVSFPKELRDYQTNIVNVYLKYVNPVGNTFNIGETTNGNGNGAILEVPCGRGKCLGKNTPILMYDGHIKMVQDIIVGDVLMGDDSTPRNVLTLARGKEMMYKVEYINTGDFYIVNKSHILSLYSIEQNQNKNKQKTVVDIPLTEYLKMQNHSESENTKSLYGYRVPIHFEEKPLEIDPYLFGYWIGNGYSTGIIRLRLSFIIKYIVDLFKYKDKTMFLRYTGFNSEYQIQVISKDTNGTTNVFNNGIYIDKTKNINEKCIPHHYKCNSQKNQLELLAGIIDSYGSVGYHKNYYEIIEKNKRLIDDIVFLSRSIGLVVYIRKISVRNTKIQNQNQNQNDKLHYYKIKICGKILEDIPVKHPLNKIKKHRVQNYLYNRIKVTPIGNDDYYGFEIDGNRRFVLGDYTVTHNTVMALKIISEIKRKTLILVHKEFLMNQWIERIAEFLPSARVGKIQASTFDVAGKDIVIGMIQTMYSRDFPADTFDCFGLTIVDEVHRIGSEEFSKTLLKTITPYMLGISATVERKDGLTRVLNMFIGDKIYSETRADDDAVCVRGIRYLCDDDEFNETETDWKGNTKYSTMITKLCAYGPRSDFIVRILKDLITENGQGQIMVLAHNRSLLNYLHSAIEHREIASVGFYVGGMKESALKLTEEKQIVLATYAMAAEALDIKTLSILVMVTPKTDIEQSVGRILRAKHANPIVIDIIDKHDTFERQWTKRRAFYKKCNYRILTSDSPTYLKGDLGMRFDARWKTVFEPNTKMKSNCKKIETNTEEILEEKEDLSNRKCLIPMSGFIM